MSSCLTRRRLLLGCAGLLSTAMSPVSAFGSEAPPLPDLSGLPERCLRLRNPRTAEVLDAHYWRDGRYDAEVLGRIDWFMRDPHTGTAKPIDRLLLDLLCSIHSATGCSDRLTILSGYRSVRTNKALIAAGVGAVPNSYHTHGRAADLRLAGFSTKGLRALARASQIGGIGYYPRDDFLHLDTGPRRSWRG